MFKWHIRTISSKQLGELVVDDDIIGELELYDKLRIEMNSQEWPYVITRFDR